MESYFETKKFLRRLGEEIFDKLENENIYALCLENLKKKNHPPISNEVIEDLLTIVTSEESSKQNSQNIDNFTGEEYSAYLAQKSRQTPDQIFRENIKQLEGQRAVDDDDEIIEGSCNAFVALEEETTEDLVENFNMVSISPYEVINYQFNIERHAARLANLPDLRTVHVEALLNRDMHIRGHYDHVYGNNA